MAELALRFLLVGALAFGGGQAALPLVERLTVHQTGWLAPPDFALAVGLAYATPGPVLILASFVGYRVAGIPGGLVATLAVFAIPVTLSAATAGLVARLSKSPRFRGFGRFASAAAIGLLGVTVLTLARPVADVHPLLLAASAAVVVAALRGVSPIFLLVACTTGGGLIGAL